MQIVGDDRRIYRKHLPVMRYALRERTQSFVVFKIADVMRKKGVMAPREAEGVLQFGATSQDRPANIPRNRNRLRRKSARSTHEQLASAKNPHHRIVSASMDRTIVSQEKIRDRSQPPEGIAVNIRNRFV